MILGEARILRVRLITQKKNVWLLIFLFTFLFLWDIFLKNKGFFLKQKRYSYKVWKLLRKKNGFGIRSEIVLYRQWQKFNITLQHDENSQLFFVRKYGNYISPSYILCTLAHNRIWIRFKEKDTILYPLTWIWNGNLL